MSYLCGMSKGVFLPSHELLISEPKWVQLTLNQLKKDAQLSGIEWIDPKTPTSYKQWIKLIYDRLSLMNKSNPEQLIRFLYRVDLSEKAFLQNPLPSESMAEAVLKREFLKVWLKSQY